MEPAHPPQKRRRKPDIIGRHLVTGLILTSTVVLLMAITLVSIGSWLLVDEDNLIRDISAVVGSSVYLAAVCLIIAAGSLVTLVSLLGLIGGLKADKLLIFMYAISLTVLLLAVFIAGILGFVFRAEFSDKVKGKMEDTLTTKYETDLNKGHNIKVTDGWNKLQERLRCCAVEDEGWMLYRESHWFRQYGSRLFRETVRSSNTDMPYVPFSCCRTDEDYKMLDLRLCQNNQFGPPRWAEGTRNSYLNYPGCYSAAKSYYMDRTVVIVCLGIIFAAFMAVSVVFAFLTALRIQRQEKRREARKAQVAIRMDPLRESSYS